jgi:hypothetical protein
VNQQAAVLTTVRSRVRMPVPAVLLVLVFGILSFTVGSASAASWLEPQDISAANEVVDGRPEVAVDPAGDAVAIWERHVGGEEIVEASERPAGGDWSASEVLSLPGEEGERTQVTIDAAGNAIAVWVPLVANGLDPKTSPTRSRQRAIRSLRSTPRTKQSPSGPPLKAATSSSRGPFDPRAASGPNPTTSSRRARM